MESIWYNIGGHCTGLEGKTAAKAAMPYHKANLSGHGVTLYLGELPCVY